MAKVKRVSASVIRLWCAGCVGYHSFGLGTSGFDGSYERPTFVNPLVVSDGKGNVQCAMIVQEGIMTYGQASRHKLAGQRVEMTEGRL
jgi:hypothetical protein